jgi:hypothetical protein
MIVKKSLGGCYEKANIIPGTLITVCLLNC